MKKSKKSRLQEIEEIQKQVQEYKERMNGMYNGLHDQMLKEQEEEMQRYSKKLQKLVDTFDPMTNKLFNRLADAGYIEKISSAIRVDEEILIDMFKDVIDPFIKEQKWNTKLNRVLDE